MSEKKPEAYVGAALGTFVNHSDEIFMVDGYMVPEYISNIVFDPKKIKDDEDLWHCIYDKNSIDACWGSPLSQFKIKSMLKLDDDQPWQIWLDEE